MNSSFFSLFSRITKLLKKEGNSTYITLSLTARKKISDDGGASGSKDAAGPSTSKSGQDQNPGAAAKKEEDDDTADIATPELRYHWAA